MDREHVPAPKNYNFSEYHCSEKTGFALECPLEDLPDYFRPWQSIASRIAELLTKNSLRHEVNKMPLLDHTRLQGYRQWRLAFTQLSCIGSAYVWQGGLTDVVKSLPSQLAVPWYRIAKYLGMPPGINYSGICLANYRMLDQTKPVTLGNIKTLYNLGPSEHSNAFFKVTLMAEIYAISGIQAICRCMKAVTEGDGNQVMRELETISQSLAYMTMNFGKFDELLTPGDFHDEVLPFVAGWGGEGNPMPEGLVYEGISTDPIEIMGASAGQSPSIHCFDVALRIEHGPDKLAYLQKLRSYMAPAHANMIEAIRKGPNIKCFVEASRTARPEMQENFNRCVAALADFRTQHVKMVTRYVLLPTTKVQKHQDDATSKGTGGQPPIPILKGLRDSTKDGTLV